MKVKGLIGFASALLIVLAPLPAVAATTPITDPGVLPIDQILEQTSAYSTEIKRVHNSGRALEDFEEGNLERALSILEDNYGVEFVVEYLRTFPSGDSSAWSAERSKQLSLNSSEIPFVYLNVAVSDREFWVVPNEAFETQVSEEAQELIIQDYLMPDFKNNHFLRGLAISAEALARSYNGLPLFDTSSEVMQNEVFVPAPVTSTETSTENAPATEERSEEELAAARQGAQDRLDAYLLEEEEASEINFTGLLATLLWIFGIFIAVLIVRAIVKTIRAGKLKKRKALELIEEKRIQRLVDQLAPRLRNSTEFATTQTLDERSKLAEKASFSLFGLKAADKDLVIKKASELVHKELATVNGSGKVLDPEMLKQTVQRLSEQYSSKDPNK